MTDRRSPNLTEKTAAALLRIKVGADGGRWLIPEPLRTSGTAKEICAAVDWDHMRRHAEGGSMAPQNLDPMVRAEHREKSKLDTTEVAKGKRMGKKEEAFREKLMAKAGAEIAKVEKAARVKPKSGWNTRFRKKMSGEVVSR